MSEFKREIQFVVAQEGVADAAYDTITAAMDDYSKRQGFAKFVMVTRDTFIEKWGLSRCAATARSSRVSATCTG
jgi:hypothetical protein